MSKYFEVAKILAVRSIDERKEYRVSWKDFGSKDDAWVPEQDCQNEWNELKSQDRLSSAGACALFFGVTINYFLFNKEKQVCFFFVRLLSKTKKAIVLKPIKNIWKGFYLIIKGKQQ